MKKEALLYERLPDQAVRCFLCAHQCRIMRDKFGFCGVRQNLDGVLHTYAYGEVIAAHVDPIEKKPLYHFFPGSSSFSIATAGCNFRCGFCQNWQISQQTFEGRHPLQGEALSPREIVESALRYNCKSISYTYTEPTIFFEYALETMKLAKQEKLYNVFVTNGYMSKECLETGGPYLDAANVDLKFFDNDAYRRICRGSLQPVLDSIRLMHKLGVWVEVTTLLINGENDSHDGLTGIAQFIAATDKNIPWHICRFHPDYKFSLRSATLESTIKKAIDIAKAAGLKYVYAGNVYGFGNDTNCPACGKVLIKREGFQILENNLKGSRCAYCDEVISGVFTQDK